MLSVSMHVHTGLLAMWIQLQAPGIQIHVFLFGELISGFCSFQAVLSAKSYAKASDIVTMANVLKYRSKFRLQYKVWGLEW